MMIILYHYYISIRGIMELLKGLLGGYWGRSLRFWNWIFQLKVIPWYKNFEIWVGIRTLLLFLCFCRWLASSGNQKFGVSPVRFKRSKDLLERSIIPPSLDLPKFQFFVSLLDPEPVFFGRFPLFGRFQAERARTSPPNPDVSVSNDPFSPRNSFSALIFGRTCIFDITFWQFSIFIFWVMRASPKVQFCNPLGGARQRWAISL